ncbi:MAG: response regulator [Pseudomonadota bacterium]
MTNLSERGKNRAISPSEIPAFGHADQMLWSSLQSVSDGFAFFGPDNKLIGANTAYLSSFDGIAEMRPGIHYFRMLELILEKNLIDIGDLTAPAWLRRMTDRWRSNQPEEVILHLTDGEYVRLIDRRGPDGETVSIGTNVTKSIRTELELRDARRRAEAANHAKSAFLANMSHEIRTPMNGVVGMAELLIDTDLTDDQRLYVKTIKNSGEALLEIINDVLDFSKIEAQKLTLHTKPFDLERCIIEVVMLLQPAALEKGLTVAVDYDMFLPTRYVGDPIRVRQILTNLIGNAVKFTEAGHVLIRVTGVPRSDAAATAVHVAIEDTGIGIANEKLGHIFGEFNQAEDNHSRPFEGTGLGLAITKRLVDMMDGSLWVESEPNVGSCFGFKLTLPKAKPSQTKPLRLPDRVAHALVVDDLEINCIILEKQIGLMGGRATICRSGADALAAMNSSVDLVLTDHHMPNMNGLELADALRSAGWKDVPIVLHSSNPAAVQNDPMKRHVQGILQKPIPRDELFAFLGGLEKNKDGLTQAVHENRPASARKLTIPKLPDHRLQLLVAEDNRTNQLVFTKMVKDLPVDVHFVGTGQEVLDLFPQIQPDIVFMDISMPGMDGKTATSFLRKKEVGAGHHTPVVAITAFAAQDALQDILASGIDDVLTKPLRKAELWDRIALHCAKAD